MSRYYQNVSMTDKIYNNIVENCSRKTASLTPGKGDFQLAYGLDHACGWFLSWFPKNDDAIQAMEDVTYEGNEECVDMDGIFTGFTGAELGFILKEFGGNPQHIDNAYMDFGF